MRIPLTIFFGITLYFSSISLWSAETCAENLGAWCGRDSDCCPDVCTPGTNINFGYVKGKHVIKSSQGLTPWDPAKSWSVKTKCKWPTFKCVATYIDGDACDGKISR